MKYRSLKGYKYQTTDDFLGEIDELKGVQLATDWFTLEAGEIWIKAGYSWDGASGPTWDTKSTLTASLVHDVLYQAMRMGLLHPKFRKTADEVLYQLMLKAPTGKLGRVWSSIRAMYYYAGVRLFAGFAIKPRKEAISIIHTVTP